MKKLLILAALLSSTASALTTQQVITAFQKAGLEASKPTPITREGYGMAPLVGKGVRFLIPSLGEDAGGRVFDVPNAAQRTKLARYYTALGEESAMLYSHVFVYKNIVVQINGELSDAKAAKYKAALMKLK